MPSVTEEMETSEKLKQQILTIINNGKVEFSEQNNIKEILCKLRLFHVGSIYRFILENAFLDNSDEQEICANLFDVFENYLKPAELIINMLDYSTLKPDLYAKLLEKYIAAFPNDEFIYKTLTKNTSFLKNGMINSIFNLASISQLEKQRMANVLLKNSIDNRNASLVSWLQTKQIPYFEEAIKTLTQKQFSDLKAILYHKNPDFVSNRMLEFTNGFGLGKITYEGGLLTAAQTSSRKKYRYNPTVLKPNEFKEYLSILKNSTPPLREKFVITGEHWICGEISIDKNGTVKVLFIDSVGLQLEQQRIFGSTKEAILTFASVFELSPREIYFDDRTRQYSSAGCSVFALDDVQHLYVIEDQEYLTKHYKNTGLFGYLENNHHNTMTIDNNPIKLTKLPLSLMRTEQSSSLLKNTIPGGSIDEQSTPINKKQETMLESSEKGFIEDPVSKKKQNKRLDLKLNKIADHNFEYLINCPEEQVKEQMEHFTLENFKIRLANQETLRQVEASTTHTMTTQYDLQKIKQPGKDENKNSDINKKHTL